MGVYEGSCHCGTVRFRATLALEGVMECNCSIDVRVGGLLAPVAAEQFELLAGADELGDYQFGKKHIHRMFCRTCGIHTFARGTGRGGEPMVMLNARCLEGVELGDLKVTRFDGRSL